MTITTPVPNNTDENNLIIMLLGFKYIIEVFYTIITEMWPN